MQQASHPIIDVQVIVQIDCNIRKIDVKRDGIDAQGDEYPEELLVVKNRTEPEHFRELLPIPPFVPPRLKPGMILQCEQRHYARDNDNAAHQDEEGEEVERLHEHTRHNGAEDGREYRQRGKGAAKLASITRIGNIGRPSVEACVIACRTEEAHHRVRRHDEDDGDDKRVLRQKLRRPEGDREASPADIANGDERPALARAVAPCSDQEGGQRGDNRAYPDHPRDDGRILRDFVIHERVEPCILDIPADLSCHAEHPDKRPVAPSYSLSHTPFTSSWICCSSSGSILTISRS